MADAPDTSTPSIDVKTLEKAYRLMCEAKAMAALYEAHKKVTSKYVHATSRGHEAIQLACAMQLRPEDFVAPYYRDDSILLGIGMEPYHCMLQLLAKRDDPFSGGRTYYSHPSLKDADKPKIPHQSSATGMQAIPTTGIAMGVKLKEIHGLQEADQKPVVICSIGDAAMTEGEISEALQMAGLKQLPIIYLVQDNDWDISANVAETRAQNAAEFARGFQGIETRSIDGSQFEESYQTLQEVMAIVREERRPFLVHARVPLLGHHTSGVRMEWYRDDLEEHHQRDPFPKMQALLRQNDFSQEQLEQIWEKAQARVAQDFERATAQEDPKPEDLYKHDLAPTEVSEEKGERTPADKEKTVMVDAALFAIREILEDHPEALLYGQDVGGRLGGVFREAATLAQQFGDDRVFNTPIQEAFIIGSTVGMSAAGLKPIVEVQFADYIWPGLNQLFTEASRSYYLSNGKWPVHAVIRVPIGAYGSGGPYHSSSVESILTNIRGIKVAYPSTGADLKGLLKAAYYDPNPVVLLEHKGLYWSKIKGTEDAQTVEPSRDYILPLGKGRIAYEAEQTAVKEGRSLLVVTYGRGVYWTKEAASLVEEAVEILDLRSLAPLDEDLILQRVAVHHKVLVVTEEPKGNGFAQSIAARIQQKAFQELDAPVQVLGSENMPAIPLNSTLEATMIPSAEKVAEALRMLARY
jgi:2-oxoisovalerate dehydrogenase E1 component